MKHIDALEAHNSLEEIPQYRVCLEQWRDQFRVLVNNNYIVHVDQPVVHFQFTILR